MKNKIRNILLVFFLLFTCTTNVKAEELNTTKTGSISFTLTELDSKQTVEGAQFAIYHIASVEEDASNQLVYRINDEYENFDIQLNDSNTINRLESIVINNLHTSSIMTDKQGKAKISNLPLGLYFVRQTNTVDGYTPCKSFLISIPTKEDNGYVYDVDASPKTEFEKLVSISIEKIWKASKNEKIPLEVQIQLLKDNEVVETAVLNEKNNWKIVYNNLQKSDTYSVKEINIPEGYTPIYKQNNNSFIVTNVSTLINTGQLVWPIPILTLVGILFITIGLIFLRKTGKMNE